MSDLIPLDPHRAKALELANQHIAPHAEVVARATAYHGFLTGKPTGKPATAGTTQTTAAPTQPAAAATGKPVTPPKPAGAKTPPAAGAKAAPAPGTKPAASTKSAAAAPKATPATAATPPASGQNPPLDTKAPGGTNTWKNMCDALTAVKTALGKDAALAIMTKVGGGATWARDVKPELFDAVVAAAKQAITPPKATTAGPVVVTDELGNEVDTSGASAATADENDPPEGGSGEDL